MFKAILKLIFIFIPAFFYTSMINIFVYNEELYTFEITTKKIKKDNKQKAVSYLQKLYKK